MKNVKKIGVVILAILVIPILYLSKNSIKTNKNETIAYNSVEMQQFVDSLKEEYGESYETIISKNEKATQKAELLEKSFVVENEKTIYPDNFGGSYVNENNELVVQIVNNSKAKKLKYNSANNEITLDNDIIKEVVNYSYNDLTEVNDVIINYFSNHSVDEYFVGNYVDIKNNIVVVELKEINDDYINKFKREVINSSMVEFRVGKRISTVASYKAGSLFTFTRTYVIKNGQATNEITDMNATCSIGARAKRNGVSGYITAGHCFGKMNSTPTSSILPNGTYVTRTYTKSMDAAFVKLSSGNTVTNNLDKTGYQASFINTTGQNYFTTGTAVGKVGGKSGYGNGVIGSINYSVTDDDKAYHTNLVQANIPTQNGDSGGPVFIVNIQTLSGGAPLIGIVSVGGANLVGFYNYNNIVSSLGLTKY